MAVDLLLRQAAERAASRPFYLASVVWPVAQRLAPHGPWSWIVEVSGIARPCYGCDREQKRLWHLEDQYRAARMLLCANPESELQVELIAARFGAERLKELLALCER